MPIDRNTVKSVFVQACLNGGRQVTPFEVEWDVAGRCLLPVRFDLFARKSQAARKTDWGTRMKSFDNIEDTLHSDILSDKKVSATFGEDKHGPYVVHMTVKCRKCDICLAERRKLWARRALSEVAMSGRTWFGTLTLSPEWHVRFGAQAAVRTKRRTGEELEALPLGEQLASRNVIIGAEIAKMFKRLRKSGYQFRYFLVMEAHESGLPHYHLLIHELSREIPKRVLDAAWSFGFTKYRLMTSAKEIYYVTKYLGKSNWARVRASIGYGVRSSLEVGNGHSGGWNDKLAAFSVNEKVLTSRGHEMVTTERSEGVEGGVATTGGGARGNPNRVPPKVDEDRY